ncbi:MAG: hypothetical protein HOP27_17990 [Anaerolineales bacterium]|nr:hypothetical protein [Anaerolineales bacterium]
MTNGDAPPDFHFFTKIDDRKAELTRQHETTRQSKEFQDQVRYLRRITRDFLKSTQICWFAATRYKPFVDNSLVFRSIDDLNQSVVALQTLIEEGMLTPAHREMRYILESSIKNLFVDQKAPTRNFEEKVMFLHEQVPRSSISVVDDLYMPFDDELKTTFIADIKGIYSRACAYVHPSKIQVDERVSLASIDVYIGFERPKDLERINKELFRLYEATLVLVFSALDRSSLGDIFIQWLDDEQNWRFHKGKYIKAISSIFDYKMERKERKTINKSNSGNAA